MLVILMLILMLLNLNTGYADTGTDFCLSLCCSDGFCFHVWQVKALRPFCEVSATTRIYLFPLDVIGSSPSRSVANFFIGYPEYTKCMGALLVCVAAFLLVHTSHPAI